MDKKCEHLKDILDIEKLVIRKHIDKHKWYNHITEESDGLIHFIQKYAWLMRDVYCGVLCKYNKECGYGRVFQQNTFLDDVSDGEIEKYIRMYYIDNDQRLVCMFLKIIKHNIKDHKWLNKINNYEDAVKDFMDKFGWLILDMYKRKENIR